MKPTKGDVLAIVLSNNKSRNRQPDQICISAIRLYLDEKKLPHNSLIDLTIQYGLTVANISLNTVRVARQIAHIPAIFV